MRCWWWGHRSLVAGPFRTRRKKPFFKRCCGRIWGRMTLWSPSFFSFEGERLVLILLCYWPLVFFSNSFAIYLLKLYIICFVWYSTDLLAHQRHAVIWKQESAPYLVIQLSFKSFDTISLQNVGFFSFTERSRLYSHLFDIWLFFPVCRWLVKMSRGNRNHPADLTRI